MRSFVALFGIALLTIVTAAGGASPESERHPRPAGTVEPGAYGEKKVSFQSLSKEAEVLFDTTIVWPGSEVPAFQVDSVEVNGQNRGRFLFQNSGILNFNHWAHGGEDVSLSVYTGWEPGQDYEITVSGKTPEGKLVALAASEKAPGERQSVKSLSFAKPTAEFSYHHASLTLAAEVIESGTVTRVAVDGERNRDARYFNEGPRDPKAGDSLGLEGETYTGRVDGSRDFRVVVPCKWTTGSKHKVEVAIKGESGEEKNYSHESTASGSGGYWNLDWAHCVSVTLKETAGLLRSGEPVHLMLGLFSDHLTDPAKEIRVVAYDPTSPKAGADGYLVAPCQIISVDKWHDEKAMATVETDPETGERVHRYNPATTVELVFLADVLPYEEKVYQVLYGNPNATAQVVESDLTSKPTTGIGQIVETAHYRIGLATNSGAVDSVTILGDGDPVLLEHRLETNGAVHWNPDCYSPPIPWVHASDWEAPEFAQIAGPVMRRTRSYADLPHMNTVAANFTYTFYRDQPYIEWSSVMEIKEEIFVKALRNAEIVFNHAVLDEFVWIDSLGALKNLPIEGSRHHPIHALEIPPDTPWMAFISRDQKVGFAMLQLEYTNTNLCGDPTSEAQPYIYVQNGPWIYWSRGLVYPFGGMNFSRLMRVRKGSLYIEKAAWYPFRFAGGDDPFAEVKAYHKKLTHPLLKHEWMGTDPRTPEKWVMPILTAPFDEGVKGAVSGHKEK